MNQPVFFDGFADLGRVLIAAPIMYGAIILFIRISGKRSTSQMNNFDWVVTVALGSLLASGLMLRDVTIFETLLAIASLLALQWILTKLIYHYRTVSRLIKAEPALLVSDGKYLTEAMRRERVNTDEVLAAIRAQGIPDLNDVRWVILEADAKMSVIRKGDTGASTDAPDGVPGFNLHQK